MRDLFVATLVFGALPFVLKRPFIGILLMTGLGYMNPHRLCYGFMLTMPVVQIVAAVTLIGMLISKEEKKLVWGRELTVLVMFIAWMGVTTSMAFYPQVAAEQYEKVIKIQILTLMTLVMLTSRQKVEWFVWAIVLSLGFYGIKGGLFTIAKGGTNRVQGPIGSFIAGNNELALALVMTIPLMRYLHLQATNRWVRHGLMASMLLTTLAAIGSQSRGALVGLLVMGTAFWLKGRQKVRTALLILVAVGGVLAVMPAEWYERMNTIKTYDEDASAMGRILAWKMAYNLANDRVTGGGYETWQPPIFARYGGGGREARDVHSIYFEVLGEHGWIGLGLFLAMLLLAWWKCRSIMRMARRDPRLAWAADLGAMVQVSMMGYMTAGAFLGLAYFDYIYHLVAIVVVVHHLVRRQLATPAAVPLRPGPALQPLR